MGAGPRAVLGEEVGEAHPAASASGQRERKHHRQHHPHQQSGGESEEPADEVEEEKEAVRPGLAIPKSAPARLLGVDDSIVNFGSPAMSCEC